MSELDTLPQLPENLEDLLNNAQERISENRRRPVANRFFFGTNDTVDGQPRLTRVAVRAQMTNAKEMQFVLTTAITIDGFMTNSPLHQLDRYSNFTKRQVARVRTQQWVNEDNADEIQNLIDLMSNHFGWRLLNNPANLNEQRKTRDITVLTPTESFDPDNPSHYGLPIDFEISGERDPQRKDTSFDGNFVEVADQTQRRIENFIAMTPPAGGNEQQMEDFQKLQAERVEDLIQQLSAVTGRYTDEQHQQWAKNCTSGAFRLPVDLKEYQPGAKVIGDFYSRVPDVDGNVVYEADESKFEEIRLYGNTQTTDENGRVISSALQDAIADAKAHNMKVRKSGGTPDGSDEEFSDDNENAFTRIANELRGDNS